MVASVPKQRLPRREVHRNRRFRHACAVGTMTGRARATMREASGGDELLQVSGFKRFLRWRTKWLRQS